MAQLPRCVQQASWNRVWSKVGGVMSMQGVCCRMIRSAGVPIPGLLGGPRSQSLLILSRSSSSSSHHISRSALPCGERIRNTRPGFNKGFSGNLADGLLVSSTVLRTTCLSSLSSFLVRGLSTAEASALADGLLKDTLLRDAEEKSGASLGAAEKETEKALLTEVEKKAEPSSEILSVVEHETEESLLTDAEEKVSLEGVEKEQGKALLPDVDETAGGSLEILSAVELETKKANDRDALVAEIKSKELELKELRSALKLADEKQGVLLESDSLAPGFAEVEDPAEQAAALHVSAALHEPVHDSVSAPKGTPSRLAEELASDNSSQAANGNFTEERLSMNASQTRDNEELTSETSASSESIVHPWPEWIQFLKQLEKGGQFESEDDKEIDLNGSTNEDLGLIKRACLNFARERDDIFLHYSRKDLEVIARFGCPCTDRKVVNSGKRLRDFLAIDEISVCKPCALRSSCDRADFKASADHVVGTPEIIRLLSQYALEVSPSSSGGLEIPSAVQQSCKNLLKETVALGATARDPRLPKVERKAETAKIPRRERESKRRIRDADVEMKPGDWKCEKCQYVNFARNRTCRECDAFRPAPEMRPGDWRCPSCDFVNFSRNQVCHDCKVDKPAGAGFESTFDRGSRYDRGAPQERGSRFDRGSSRGRQSEVRSYDRGSERGSFGRSEPRDYERGFDRFESRGRDRESFGRDRESFGRSRERGGLERSSGSEDVRGGRRSNYEEWKPDLKRKGKFDEDEDKDRRSALDLDDDEEDYRNDEFDDSEGDDDDEDISDVEAFEDEEFEDMRPAALSRKGRDDAGRGQEGRSRSVGRSEEKDPWWEDDRGFRSERSERGSRGGGGRGRGGGRGGGRGDFGRDSRSSSRDSRDSRTSSYERFDRDSGRSYGNSSRDSGRPSRGRGGGRGGGRGRGRGR